MSTRGPFQGHAVAAVTTAGQDTNMSNSSSAEAEFGPDEISRGGGSVCTEGRVYLPDTHF